MSDSSKSIVSILKSVWEDSHRCSSLKIGDIVQDTRKGFIGMVIGFKPVSFSVGQLPIFAVEARCKVNFNASGTTERTLLGKTPIAILLTLEPDANLEEELSFRIRYTSGNYLKKIEPDKGIYNEGLTLIKEHCQSECILECTPECSLYKYK